MSLPRMTVSVSRDGRQDVRDQIRHLATAGRAYVELLPSGVLAALSEARSTPLLRVIRPGDEERSRTDAAPKIGDAALSGSGMASALRYYAYRYIELLWASAAAGQWGTPAVATQIAKERRGHPIIGAYGVAQRGARAWYQVLKGRSSGRVAHDQGADARMGVSAEIDVQVSE